MTKRTFQDWFRNGPIRMDGENRIERCFDCSQRAACKIVKKWKWIHGPLPMECPLPKR